MKHFSSSAAVGNVLLILIGVFAHSSSGMSIETSTTGLRMFEISGNTSSSYMNNDQGIYGATTPESILCAENCHRNHAHSNFTEMQNKKFGGQFQNATVQAQWVVLDSNSTENQEQEQLIRIARSTESFNVSESMYEGIADATCTDVGNKLTNFVGIKIDSTINPDLGPALFNYCKSYVVLGSVVQKVFNSFMQSYPY